jgi:hypothetical protein
MSVNVKAIPDVDPPESRVSLDVAMARNLERYFRTGSVKKNLGVYSYSSWEVGYVAVVLYDVYHLALKKVPGRKQKRVHRWGWTKDFSEYFLFDSFSRLIRNIIAIIFMCGKIYPFCVKLFTSLLWIVHSSCRSNNLDFDGQNVLRFAT